MTQTDSNGCSMQYLEHRSGSGMPVVLRQVTCSSSTHLGAALQREFCF